MLFYKASKEKSKLLKPDAEWLGYKTTKEGIKPLRDKTEAIRKLKPPKNVKDTRSFLGSVQYLAKHIPNLSEKKQSRSENYWRKIAPGIGANNTKRR